MLHKHQQKGPNIVCIEWEKNDEHKRKKKKRMRLACQTHLA